MASSHRRKLLSEVANREREMESDVLARIALDEITELEAKINEMLHGIKKDLSILVPIESPQSTKGKV